MLKIIILKVFEKKYIRKLAIWRTEIPIGFLNDRSRGPARAKRDCGGRSTLLERTKGEGKALRIALKI
jgi:hypothetical protein